MLTFIIYWFLFVLLTVPHISVAQFRFYHSDPVSEGDFYHDCLLYNKGFNSYEIIPFCMKPLDPHNTLKLDESEIIYETSTNFEALKIQNVTSHQLYLLFIPVDIVEGYQAFLESSNQSFSTVVLYYCSTPWFGEYCQYMFQEKYLFNKPQSFGDIAEQHLFESRSYFSSRTCYTFIECDRGAAPSCLDWREICDGKIDCLDGGGDELLCEEMYSNECAENEYRCSNGLCVPDSFFQDDSYSMDCMDRSDESERTSATCSHDFSFHCEETACRNERTLSCGNGECSERHNCRNKRDKLLQQAKLSQNANLHLSVLCWTRLICLTLTFNDRIELFKSVNCTAGNTSNIIHENCSTFFFFPAQPVVLRHVRFAYTNNLTNINNRDKILLPTYVCYDQQLCEMLPGSISTNNSSCRLLSELNLDQPLNDYETIESRTLIFFLKCSTIKNNYTECPISKPFRCANSTKCIALDRLLDGFSDCFEEDDENIKDSCSLPDKNYRIYCSLENRCYPLNTREWKVKNCIDSEREIVGGNVSMLSSVLSFQTLCNGFVEFWNDDNNNTDEIDCEHWPCNNAYTRCDNDGRWNCRNGADEVNCSSNPCSPSSHRCLSLHTHNFTCLSLSQINDGHVDCLGYYDEPAEGFFQVRLNIYHKYRCINETKWLLMMQVCDPNKTKDCASGDDEGDWCPPRFDYAPTYFDSSPWRIEVDLYLKRFSSRFSLSSSPFFKVTNHLIYPTNINRTVTVDFNASISAETIRTDESNYNLNRQLIDNQADIFCNRGFPIYSRYSQGIACLCSPAYFGNRCEYQSQRVSLTLEFRTIQWRTLFTFVMMLIDDNTNINSYEQVDYLAVRDCRKKFNFYLLYSTRPKYHNLTYYVRIDVYDKMKMEYYVSMLYPVRFSFLPVYRLSLQVNVPVREHLIISKTCPLKCLYGQCTRYMNLNKFFCRCLNGSSGKLCTIKNDCNCSPDSVCVGTVNNRSICVCPMNTFGPRCYLKNTVCMENPCHNGSTCVPTDVKISESQYWCVCPNGLIGSRCENLNQRIEFLFAKSIIIPQSILIHFIEVLRKFSYSFHPLYPLKLVDGPRQTTMISKVESYQSSIVVFYETTFHLIFVEFDQNYYFALLQHNYTSFVSILTTIIPEHRCVHISELLDIQIGQLPRWHRAKYYHIPCQTRIGLVCFYDNDYFMCLCDIDRHANCFKFNYRREHNCPGYNYCENGGLCNVDNGTCPTVSACVCTKCYYGNRCQFTSTGSSLSLDGILGYSIWPNVPFSRQPVAVKVSATLTVVMFVIAIINGVLSIITFRTKRSLGVGCGFYLFASSITSCLTITMFTLKFVLLVLSQMLIITNYSFLLFNCIIVDMFLKSFVAIGEWLYACVAIERTFTIYIGVNFNKTKSKKMAKWIIFAICIFTLTSYIHDPIHRALLEDNEEQRKWCVVRYSSSIQIYASFINIFHFLLPLSINVISVLLTMILIARQKFKMDGKQTYREHLLKQFQQHKHGLFSSFFLIIIAMPRLIISFVSECMKSARNPWLYLVGYFVSFASPLFVFVLFILPSEFYRKEFKEATMHIKKTIQRRFQRE
jgi:hypothetical protein